MISRMKTTVEISDALLVEARKTAAREGVTLRSLIEQGLRHALSQRKQHGQFRLRKATFKGRGIRMSIVAAAEHAARSCLPFDLGETSQIVRQFERPLAYAEGKERIQPGR